MYWLLAALLLIVVAFRLYLWRTDQHVYFHYQNTSDKDRPEPTWRNGRCWWMLSPNDENKHTRYPRPTLHPWWHLFHRSSSADVSFRIASEEEDLAFHLAIPWLATLGLTFSELPFLYRLFRGVRQGFGYETGIRWSDGSLYVHVIHCNAWGSSTVHRWWIPGWIHVWKGTGYKEYPGVGFYVTFLFDNLILGSREYEKVELWPVPVIAEIQIEPDNSLGFRYFGTFMGERHSWWRKHFPWFKQTHHYVDIRCENPPLHSGKGENSYDQDDDGIFGMGVPGTTIDEAIAGYQEAVKRDRQKYGMPGDIHEAQKRSLEL